MKHKENFTRSLKTENSELEFSKIKRGHLWGQHQNSGEMFAETPSAQVYQSQSFQNGCTPDKNQKLSTSRALEMFSKVYKNEGIERMRIRKEVIMNKTTDVQVKQMKLQDKN